MQLETKRLLIRPLQPNDQTALFAYRSDATTNQYQGWVPKTLAEVADFIARATPTFDTPDTWFQLALIEKSSNQLIGDLGLHFMGSQNRQVEVGCTLNALFHHQGFAVEALSEVVDFLFTKKNKHRITASVDPRNEPSMRLVERVGFRKEAHFIKSLFFKGEWVDDIVYALLQEEWTR